MPGSPRPATVDDDARIVAALTAAACVIALTLPSLLSGGNPAGVRARISRQVGRTLPQRLGVDLVLVVLAVIGLWQLRLYGSPLTANARGVLGLDPLLIAAPGIGLLAGGILATRIVPRLAEVAERILSRRSGLVASIGARQLARRPLRYTRSALLLMLAAALGTFAASDAATWAASQEDQATYAAAADLRMTISDYGGAADVGDWARRSARSTASRRAAPVVRGPVDVGRAIRGGQLLAFDPATAPALVNYPDESSAATLPPLLGRLADERPPTNAVPIDGTPLRLALVVDAAIAADLTVRSRRTSPPEELPADWRGIDVTLLLEDADGRLHKVASEQPGLMSGDGQRIEIPLTQDVGGRRVAVPGTGPAPGRRAVVPDAVAADPGGRDRDGRHPRPRGERIRDGRRRLAAASTGALRPRASTGRRRGSARRGRSRRRPARRAASSSATSRPPRSRSSAAAARCSVRRRRRPTRSSCRPSSGRRSST